MTLSIEKREMIIKLHQEGFSHSKKAELIGCSLSTIKNIIRNYALNDSLEPKKPPGRKKVLEDRIERVIKNLLLNGTCHTLGQVRRYLSKNYNVLVSINTIRRSLQRQGITLEGLKFQKYAILFL
ncbi:hypothetical protein DICPUDRAFT_158728 [Dictyostelium purpureum]|uniref:Transposase IS30-like HTH domain-containing protein n=1 Tax=Dictyostelium purpureum TaxID=5786 RepID=F1A2B5_DICPU|nr:uncharacterized protein DICPUDRAFT_158728 [Dictyostelium purpureum]EGC29671.1 hypothetical protein DICPUDRAFT_158728 [Dictyostelium purpureum]|eukprot:XP_003293804.1 hypothetical protein DICPUDRAFT_158728 [Dictyostelium purpureum]